VVRPDELHRERIVGAQDAAIIPAPTKQFFDFEFQGQTFDRFDVNTTINAEKAHVQGIELTYAQQLRFLPSPLEGLGVGTSATFIGSGVKVARGAEVLILPLLQQAKRLTSLTVYYQRGRFDVSTIYKYNANFRADDGDSRALDLDQGAFGRWDCRAQFDLARFPSYLESSPSYLGSLGSSGLGR
jgi:outer membrane receptor protein involved in Fe transport